jgi:hypothetical protein
MMRPRLRAAAVNPKRQLLALCARIGYTPPRR